MTTSGPGSETTTQPAAGPEAAAAVTVAAGEQDLRQQIEQTREQLGATVDQLAAKADVKARAAGRAAEMKATAQGKAVRLKANAAELSGQLRRGEMVRRRWPLAVAAAGVLVIGSALIWMRRRS